MSPKTYVDGMAFAIFAEKADELAYDSTGRYHVYESKEKAEEARKSLQPSMWPWRVAPLHIRNGGFVPNEVA